VTSEIEAAVKNIAKFADNYLKYAAKAKFTEPAEGDSAALAQLRDAISSLEDNLDPLTNAANDFNRIRVPLTKLVFAVDTDWRQSGKGHNVWLKNGKTASQHEADLAAKASGPKANAKKRAGK